MEVHDAKPEEEGQKKLRGRRGKGCPLSKSIDPHLAGRKQQYIFEFLLLQVQATSERALVAVHTCPYYVFSLIIVFDGDLIVFHIKWLDTANSCPLTIK